MSGRRTDANHQAVMLAFYHFGASVHSTHTVGKGFPDLVVGWKGENILVEIKDGNKKLTKLEVGFHESWQGRVEIARRLEDVPRILGIEREER